MIIDKLKKPSHHDLYIYHGSNLSDFKVDVSRFDHFFFRQQILFARRDDHVYERLEHPVFAVFRHVHTAPATGGCKPQQIDPVSTGRA